MPEFKTFKEAVAAAEAVQKWNEAQPKAKTLSDRIKEIAARLKEFNGSFNQNY